MNAGILTDQTPSVQKVITTGLPDWSYSRMQALVSCPRKYYYIYYGGKKFSALEQTDKEVIQFLKSLSTGHLLVGDVVHHVIKTYFKKLKKGEIWDLGRLQSFGYRILKEAVAYSVELRNDVFKSYDYTPRSLQEIYYNELPPSAYRDQLRSEINHHLTVFYKSAQFDHLRSGAQSDSAVIESRTRFVLAGIDVDGAVDLLFENGDQVIIADWKTGEREIEDTSLQLLTYAWWAIESRGIAKDKISIQKAYLKEDALEVLEFSDTHLQRARARIIQDSERLSELDGFGKEGIIDAFTPCRQEKVCAQCPFKKICSKE
jgi:CRISPR/Cas system-associated exonuclease Cas4 (RecB family)